MYFHHDFFRRADREYTNNDRICSCHFLDGRKENGPSIFIFTKHQFHDPEPPTPKKRYLLLIVYCKHIKNTLHFLTIVSKINKATQIHLFNITYFQYKVKLF